MVEAYPLKWPEGWPRTRPLVRKRSSPFQTTFDKARRDLHYELRALGATNVVISSWLPLRLDGNPYANAARRNMEDPGVAIYFTLNGRQMTMARDAYESIHDNLRSVGLAIEHLRGLERHGGGFMMERAFEGFLALPAPGNADWRTVLGDHATFESAKMDYRALAKAAHPDSPGGSHAKMAKLNAAIAQAASYFNAK